jgi:di/tricarboxylate transporter
MTWEGWFTLAVVVATVAALVTETVPPSAAVFGGTVVLLVAGVLEPAEAFAGFSNPAPITVAALYIIAGAVERTGILNPIVGRVLGPASSDRMGLARLLVPVAGASAFLNNTPIVAALVPAVSRWAARSGRSVSKLLMPLSFAAVLGGMVTVIGTSTNLVVSGLLDEHGLEPLGFFEIGKVGAPVALAGLAIIVAAAPVVLPRRRAARRDLEGDVREFVVDVRVDAGGPLDGMTVAQGNLRHLSGVFLVQLERHGRVTAPVSPETELRGGDRLRFVGRASEVVDLHNTRGLTPEAQDQIERFDLTQQTFYEVVVGAASPLVGRTLREVNFRGTYHAAVVAIHRADQRVDAKLGEVRLRVGDTLLIISDRAFRTRYHDRSDFLLVSRLYGAEAARSTKGPLAVAIGAAVVIAAGTGLVGILDASLIGAFAVVLLGVLTPAEARAALDLDVLLVIASAFGIGAAVEKTGLAATVADGIVGALDGFGDVAVLAGIVLATVALTELITNNAAAVLLFPIALATAADIGAEPHAFAVAVAIGASASFLTPIGYQTNTMVWGPGGYRFTDYARLGFPLTLVTVITTVILIPAFWTV